MPVIQGTSEMVVTRQAGLPPGPQEPVADPSFDMTIIQGSTEIHATRQTGLPGAQRMVGHDIIADHVAIENAPVFVDRDIKANGDANQPAPMIAPSDIQLPPPSTFDVPPAAAGAPPAQPPVAGIMQADHPGDGGADPRAKVSPPQVFTREEIERAKAARAPAPQVVLPTDVPAKPTVRRAKAAKKAGR